MSTMTVNNPTSRLRFGLARIDITPPMNAPTSVMTTP